MNRMTEREVDQKRQLMARREWQQEARSKGAGCSEVNFGFGQVCIQLYTCFLRRSIYGHHQNGSLLAAG